MSDKDTSKWIKPQSEFGHLFNGRKPSPKVKGPFVVDVESMDIEDATLSAVVLVERQDDKAKCEGFGRQARDAGAALKKKRKERWAAKEDSKRVYRESWQRREPLSMDDKERKSVRLIQGSIVAGAVVFSSFELIPRAKEFPGAAFGIYSILFLTSVIALGLLLEGLFDVGSRCETPEEKANNSFIGTALFFATFIWLSISWLFYW